MNREHLYATAEPMNFTMRNDYAFKKVLGSESNKDVMSEFISLVTGINKAEIKSIWLKNNETQRASCDDKANKLGIRLRLTDDCEIDVEIQNLWFDYYSNRSTFYWSEILAENFKRRLNYEKPNKCIIINIVDQRFNLSKKLHAVYRIVGEKTAHSSAYDELLEIHFLDLTKIPRRLSTQLERWLLFMRTERHEERSILAHGSPLLEKANEVMEYFYVSESDRDMYHAARNYEDNRISMLHAARREGRSEGESIGLQKGLQQTARKMKVSRYPLSEICNLTGLTAEEAMCI